MYINILKNNKVCVQFIYTQERKINVNKEFDLKFKILEMKLSHDFGKAHETDKYLVSLAIPFKILLSNHFLGQQTT